MTNKADIDIACMSLMWGTGLSDSEMQAWISDVKAAGYSGVATFERDITRFIDETDFEARLRDTGLSLASVNLVIDRDFDKVKRVCETMKKLGASHLVTIGGVAGLGADMDEIAAILNQIGEIALTYDVHACFHNHSGTTGETLEETELLTGKTDPNKFFGFVDVGHATQDFSSHPVAQRASIFLERNWERIDFIEFKDWSEEYQLNTEVGAGACDYESVFQILKDKQYTGWITVEQNGPMGDKTPLECAKASRDYIRNELGV